MMVQLVGWTLDTKRQSKATVAWSFLDSVTGRCLRHDSFQLTVVAEYRHGN